MIRIPFFLTSNKLDGAWRLYTFFLICSGYMSPEYVVFGKFSTKSDVFSFGVILFEIITGKKSNGFCQEGWNLSLIGYVSKLNFWHASPSKLLPMNIELMLIIHSFFLVNAMNFTDMAIMERRETTGDNWFIPKGVISNSWNIEMHSNWAFMCARRCNGQANHVSSAFNVE